MQAFSDPRKVGQAADVELRQVLVVAYTLTGLTNYPTEAQDVVLLNFMRSNYGTFALKEITVAFELAVAGKIDVDTNHFQQFSSAYFARVMNAYKVWVSEVRKQHDTYKPTSRISDITVDEWRAQIQKQYEGFTEETNYRLWPTEFYDQLVSDGFIQFGWHKKYLRDAKNILCGEVHQEVVKTEDEVKLKNYENQIAGYRSGARDFEILLLAKQLSVKELFEFGKTVDTKSFYTQE